MRGYRLVVFCLSFAVVACSDVFVGNITDTKHRKPCKCSSDNNMDEGASDGFTTYMHVLDKERANSFKLQITA